MKKILYSTTAFVAAAMIASSAMADGVPSSKRSGSAMSSKQVRATSQMQAAPRTAQAFNVSVSGFSNWYMGYIDNDKDDQLSTNAFDVMGDTEIALNFETTLKNGIKVGGVVEFEGGTDNNSSNNMVDRSYVFVESKYGKLMAGRHDNVNKQMFRSAFDLGALDIQETDFTRMVISSNLEGSSDRLDTLSTTYFFDNRDQVKLSYLSPKFYGFQAGVGYAPAASGGYDATSQHGNGGWDNTMVTAAYEGKVSDVGFVVTAGYGFSTFYGNTPTAPAFGYDSGESLDQYNVGGRVMWRGFTLSAGYKYVDYDRNEANVWDAGVAYEQGPYGVSVAYIYGKESISNSGVDPKLSTLLVSAKYNLAAGVDSFATFGYGKYEDTFTAAVGEDNDGWAIIGGMMLTF